MSIEYENYKKVKDNKKLNENKSLNYGVMKMVQRIIKLHKIRIKKEYGIQRNLIKIIMNMLKKKIYMI